MVSVPAGCVAMPSLSGGSAERLGLDVERPRQPLDDHRRRSALDLSAFEDADEALRDLGPLCQLVLSQSLRLPQLLDDLPDLPRSQGSTPIGQNDVSRQTISLDGWRAPREAARGPLVGAGHNGRNYAAGGGARGRAEGSESDGTGRSSGGRIAVITMRTGRSSILVISLTRPAPEVIRATTSSKSLSSYMPRIQDGSGGLAWAIGVRMPTIATSIRARNAEPRRLDRMANYLRPPRLQANFCRRGPDPLTLPSPPTGGEGGGGGLSWGERDVEGLSNGEEGCEESFH